MSGFPILDLVVGIIFVYFLLSIISSSAIEIILTGLKARPKMLRRWLFEIFNKDITQPGGAKIKLGQAIMDHCSVTALSKTGESPSYIDAKNFTSALLEKITFDPNNPKSIAKDIDDLIASIENTNALSTEFQRVLLTYASEAKDAYRSVSQKTASEMQIFRTKIEKWYDSSMDRVSGKLKKKYSRPATFIVAIIITCCLNADSISIAKYLYSNPDARTKLATEAYDATKDSTLKEQVVQIRSHMPSLRDSMNYDDIKNSINSKISDISRAKQSLSDVLPLTWNRDELHDENGKFSSLLLFSKITGLLATILAIMMGAPFWFDLLNKISNLRGSGTKPPPSSGNDQSTTGA